MSYAVVRRRRFPSRVSPLVAALLAGAAHAAPPAVEHVEQVAADAHRAGGVAGTTVTNSWGGHQSRITRHDDGTLRALYLRNDAAGHLQWRLMKRAPGTTTWKAEVAHPTTDDVNLLRDPRSDRAHVIGWPASVPTTYTSPWFVPKAMPGQWQALPPSARHYGGAGIGADGTACLKVVQERAGTGSVFGPYLCGRYSAASHAWSWNAQVVPYEGLRHAYSYVFPQVTGDGSFLSVAQRDLRKDVAGLPYAGNAYVFNGVRMFRGDMADGSGWAQSDVAEPVYAPFTASDAPVTSQIDAYVDRALRVYSTYYVDDPLDARTRGIYTVVADSHGNALWRGRWKGLPGYGKARMFEDAKGRLWLLWSGRGSLRTEVRVYPVRVTTQPALSFALDTPTDVSAAFAPYAFDGSLALTLPRNGHAPSQTVDGLMFACATNFTAGAKYDNAQCYGSDGGGKQRVVAFRLRLPD